YGAADAEAERIETVRSGGIEGDVDRLQHAKFKIIIPPQVPEFRWDIPPRNHKYRMALLNGVAHKRVLWREVENVELVDAGRDYKQRILMHGRRRWRILDDLDQPVLVDH